MTRTPAHWSWTCMNDRCYRANNASYPMYGAKGITVCDRWRHSFENFFADMGERPKGKTLDRYPDKGGDYGPGNCRWATNAEQAANKRPRPKCGPYKKRKINVDT